MIKRFFVVLICVSFAFSAGMHLPGIGAKSIAMGGAFRAISDDPTAIYWNPAGMNSIENSTLYFNGQLINNDFAYTPHDSILSLAHVLRDDKSKMTSSLFFLPHAFGVLVPKNPKFRFGMGIYAPLGVASTWNVMKDDDLDYVTEFPLLGTNYELTTTEELPEEDFVGSISALTFSPAVSYEITDNISLGFAGLFSYSMFSVDMPSLDSTRMINDTGIVIQHADMDGINYGFNIGIHAKPCKKLRLGANLKWESSINYSGDYSETIYGFYNESLCENIGILCGGIRETEKVDSEVELTRPLRCGAGIAYDITENLTLSGDISYTHWSVLDTIRLTEKATDSAYVEMPLGWENEMRYSLGMEYRFSRYALRTGVFYEEHPAVSEYQNLFLPDFNDNPAFNIGFSGDFGKVTLEMAGELEYFGDILTEPNYKENSGFPINVPGTYDGYVAALNLAVTYSF